MFHAFLSSAGKIQWFSAVPSNICSRSGFMVSTAGHKEGYENDTLQTSGLWTFNRILYCNCHHGTDTWWIVEYFISLSMPYVFDESWRNRLFMLHMVCMRFTHSKDRQFLLRKPLTYNLIIVVHWILSQPILWTFYTPERLYLPPWSWHLHP